MTALDRPASKQQAAAAAALAGHLAGRLAVPPPPEPGGDRSPRSPRWLGQSLARGAAGAAVLHGVRARSGLGGWERAGAWLTCAAREDLSAGTGAGLWFGAPAVAFAVAAAARPGQCRRALAALDAGVTTMVRARLAAARARMAAGGYPALAEFDVVYGLAGLGAHLLRRDPHGDLTREVLAYLVQLTKPLPAADHAGPGLPGWWACSAPSAQQARAFPGGHADLGMAHGIAGPLALLALAMRQGITVGGQAAAIGRICRWLDAWRQDGPAGPWWPERISLAELRAGRVSQPGPARPSWCYGTPGLARAQQLAGQATGDTARQEMAERALAACLSDPAQLARITDPALCHGWAGLITAAWHAAADALSPDIAARLPRLIDRLLDRAATSPGGVPGLLEGTAGIALTLHTIAAGTSGGWETCLLIS
jgi:lantibiotic biosynthesis protein